MKTYIQSGEEFTNRLGRVKRCVFIERVFRGMNNTHVDNIYHIKDVATGKITHLRNEWFQFNKWTLTIETINNKYGNININTRTIE